LIICHILQSFTSILYQFNFQVISNEIGDIQLIILKYFLILYQIYSCNDRLIICPIYI